MSERTICIHGHFYQPPRENPWLEYIEKQDSASPYHDWNERITAECYAPNSAARILDDEGRIGKIVNNYAKTSFNFGPTLLAWMEANAPSTYEAILRADELSKERFSGHGSGLAQCYNHMIMPLSNERDRRTQVHWGVVDFERRFGRRPEGMWLPETAVDIDSLEALAEQEIAFTILAPHQAGKVRRLDGDGEWEDVSDGSVDPKRAYLQKLPSGRSIVLFFYDGPTSRALAFEDLLEQGDRLSERMTQAFDGREDEAQIEHIATDGETYGHHHRHGEMALAWALDRVEARDDVRLTNYGEFLEEHPPAWEVDIIEDTSWSCVHGVERWRADCGCSSGGNPGWHQAWRGPLRDALDGLRDAVAELYRQDASQRLDDVWAARDDYIDVILDRSDENISAFLERHGVDPHDDPAAQRVLKLLEMQRHAMLMYTSCGWFFDELSGIETVQVIEYAGRVLQLVRQLFPERGNAIADEFLERLTEAPSNVPEHENGRRIYEKFVEPTMLDLRRVAAHYAVISLFDSQPEHSRIYSFEVENQRRRLRTSGALRLVIGHASVRSRITREATSFVYAALHTGAHNVTGGCLVAEPDRLQGKFDEIEGLASEIFQRAEVTELVRLIDRSFGAQTFTLRSLFRDEQRRVIDQILHPAVEDAQGMLRQLYQHRAPLLRFLAHLEIPQPETFRAAAIVTINEAIEDALEGEHIDIERIEALLEQASLADVPLHEESLSYAVANAIEQRALKFEEHPRDPECLEALSETVEVARMLPVDVPLWSAQNVWYHLATHPTHWPDDEAWIDDFRALGQSLSMSPESIEVSE